MLYILEMLQFDFHVLPYLSTWLELKLDVCSIVDEHINYAIPLLATAAAMILLFVYALRRRLLLFVLSFAI